MAGLLLVSAGCGTSAWREVENVTLAPDGRMLTVQVAFSRPPSDPEQCERVADTSVEESASTVVIGVLVDEDICDRPWPWEEPTYSMLTAYWHRVQLQLKAPLGNRVVVNTATEKPVAVRPQ
ncbi:hypothetical protein ACIBO2_41485 [Nonomuraea sp. NPDC050022]|uniref:hypothetical protein n=1 Tax=Nonomuraea sp. NPDC050022 TaxID=3364358 RepID=UPI0037BB2381